MAFWNKDAQTRIDETVAFIAGRVPANEQTVVRDFLNRFISTSYVGAAMTKVFSEVLSTRQSANPGDKDVRAARRALVILRGDMLNNAHPLKLQVPAAMAMPPAQVMQAMTIMLPQLRLFAQQEERVNTLLQTRFNEFTTNPDVFLQNHIVVTQSAPSATGTGAAENYRFLYDYKNQAFSLLPAALAKAVTFRGDGLIVNAISVPEIYWFNVPGRGRLPAPGSFARIPATELTGANLMVTSAFSGCSFCFKETAGNVYAAHISPDGTAANAGPNIGAPPTLANQLRATGNFETPLAAQAGALQVFGRGSSNLAAIPGGYTVQAVAGVPLISSSMYVFGMRIGGAWRLVYQENTLAGKTVGRLN